MRIQLRGSGTDPVRKQLSNHETEIYIGRQYTSQCRWTDFRRIRGSNSRVTTNDDATQKLARKQNLKGPRKELKEDEGCCEDDTACKGPFPAVPLQWAKARVRSGMSLGMC